MNIPIPPEVKQALANTAEIGNKLDRVIELLEQLIEIEVGE